MSPEGRNCGVPIGRGDRVGSFAETSHPTPGGRFSYEAAFARHLGLIGPDEQAKLHRSRVAIVGMGGVGGIHLITLARLGIGSFHIADPDSFELANFNRQYGATMRGLGRPKVEVMAEEVRSINPELEIRSFREPIGPDNVDAFLEGVDIFLDGIDFFALDVRRLIFREARRRGIWALTAGPVGFGAAYLVFSPAGMSFDDYFDLDDRMSRFDQLVGFVVGLAPRATHRSYMDLSKVDILSGRGPSSGLACQLCGGIAAAETLKILLGRSPIRPAPWFFQFDAYRQRLVKGRIPWGNRNPWQRLKRRLVRSALARMGWGGSG
jgi:molybdopterin/thiamine biosynthesis adenylyltransferase